MQWQTWPRNPTSLRSDACTLKNSKYQATLVLTSSKRHTKVPLLSLSSAAATGSSYWSVPKLTWSPSFSAPPPSSGPSFSTRPWTWPSTTRAAATPSSASLDKRRWGGKRSKTIKRGRWRKIWTLKVAWEYQSGSCLKSVKNNQTVLFCYFGRRWSIPRVSMIEFWKIALICIWNVDSCWKMELHLLAGSQKYM